MSTITIDKRYVPKIARNGRKYGDATIVVAPTASAAGGSVAGVATFNTRNGAVELTKADVEAVLTGAISTHSHAAGNADTLDGLHLAATNGNGGGIWNAVPWVRSDGVLEVGKYIDFHDSSYESNDFAFRLVSNGNTLNPSGAIIAAANAAGTVAQTGNIIFGTGNAPAASGVPVGTIYYKYTA